MQGRSVPHMDSLNGRSTPHMDSLNGRSAPHMDSLNGRSAPHMDYLYGMNFCTRIPWAEQTFAHGFPVHQRESLQGTLKEKYKCANVQRRDSLRGINFNAGIPCMENQFPCWDSLRGISISMQGFPSWNINFHIGIPFVEYVLECPARNQFPCWDSLRGISISMEGFPAQNQFPHRVPHQGINSLLGQIGNCFSISIRGAQGGLDYLKKHRPKNLMQPSLSVQTR